MSAHLMEGNSVMNGMFRMEVISDISKLQAGYTLICTKVNILVYADGLVLITPKDQAEILYLLKVLSNWCDLYLFWPSKRYYIFLLTNSFEIQWSKIVYPLFVCQIWITAFIMMTHVSKIYCDKESKQTRVSLYETWFLALTCNFV